VKLAVLLASAILVRPVAAVIVLTFIIRVLESHLHLPLLKAWARGRTWDASGKHIRFDFFLGSGPATDVCVSQTAM
jgi:hypothetical protein